MAKVEARQTIAIVMVKNNSNLLFLNKPYSVQEKPS